MLPPGFFRKNVAATDLPLLRTDHSPMEITRPFFKPHSIPTIPPLFLLALGTLQCRHGKLAKTQTI